MSPNYQFRILAPMLPEYSAKICLTKCGRQISSLGVAYSLFVKNMALEPRQPG